MTAQAPASSAILACSGVTTSMMTPPFNIWAKPFLIANVPVCCSISISLLYVQIDFTTPIRRVWPDQKSDTAKEKEAAPDSLSCLKDNETVGAKKGVCLTDNETVSQRY